MLCILGLILEHKIIEILQPFFVKYFKGVPLERLCPTVVKDRWIQCQIVRYELENYRYIISPI